MAEASTAGVPGERARQRPHHPSELGPRLEQRGRWFVADLRPWGGPRRQTLRDPDAPHWPAKGVRTDDPELASRWSWRYVDLLRGDRKRRALGLGAKPTKLEGLVDAYLAHRERQGSSANALRSVSAALRVHLIPVVGRATLSDGVDTLLVQAHFDDLADRGYQPSTLQTLRAVMHSFFGWVGQREGHSHNPITGVQTPELPDEDARAFDDEEVELLRDAADAIDRDGIDPAVRRRLGPSTGAFPIPAEVSMRQALELGVGTGGRQAELLALTDRAFDEAARTVRFTRQLTAHGELVPLKGKKSRVALVMPEWWDFLARAERPTRIINARPASSRGLLWVSSRWIRAVYLTAARRGGLTDVGPGIGWHALRHTYARRFLQAGGTLEQLSKFLGHASIAITERSYDHFTSDRAAESALGVFYRPAAADRRSSTSRRTHG